MTTRDTQRARVYRAEWSLDWATRRTLPIEDLQQFAAKVMASAWWRREVGEWPPVHIAKGRGDGGMIVREAGQPGFRITLGARSRSRETVLHELAHMIVTIKSQGPVAYHGPWFCWWHMALVRQFLGKEAADRLKAAYTREEVAWAKPANSE